jgi:hypothetical protein
MSRFDFDMNMLLKMLNQQNGLQVRTLDADEKPESDKAPKKEELPVKPKRCQHDGCKVKLMLVDFACRCNSFYCSQHRFAEAHKCSFDYKASGKDILEKQNPAVVAQKFERV